MKKSMLIAAVILSFGTGVALAGMAPGTGVVGSPHDMNNVSNLTADTQGRVCAFCHTPHHAIADVTGEQQPLWSHNYTQTATWKPYASPTLDAQIESDPLVGPSRLCMSCHDGVIAADQHYGGTQSGTNARLSSDDWGGVAIGKADANGVGNLSNDHPIGFLYAAVALSDSGIFTAKDRNYKGNTNTALTVEKSLTNGYMTCATCHDVHNKDNVANQGGANYFVYSPQQQSQLCLTCHAKGSEAKI